MVQLWQHNLPHEIRAVVLFPGDIKLRATRYDQSEADQFAGIAVQAGEFDVEIGACRHAGLVSNL